ncbi:hypothetical protein SAMN05421743_103341 [Thalassobacillus cyri]|uniref:Uncharacterized protein n=1 Tax=Thalassobacillus cyri TaxID=571932 RepID=A0A1H3ZR33_9BACI|nr:hypothetical protein SAMN05421743_103341 [Thalassobacillus cyri]
MPNTTFYATAELQEGMQVKATSRNFEVTSMNQHKWGEPTLV